MSFAVTSSIIWWTFRPLMAANIPRIIWGSSFRSCAAAPRTRSGCGVGCRCRSVRLRDDGAVDVGEDPLLHGAGVDCGDDGAVGDGDDEGGPVDQHQGVAGALGGRRVNAGVEPV